MLYKGFLWWGSRNGSAALHDWALVNVQTTRHILIMLLLVFLTNHYKNVPILKWFNRICLYNYWEKTQGLGWYWHKCYFNFLPIWGPQIFKASVLFSLATLLTISLKTKGLDQNKFEPIFLIPLALCFVLLLTEFHTNDCSYTLSDHHVHVAVNITASMVMTARTGSSNLQYTNRQARATCRWSKISGVLYD